MGKYIIRYEKFGCIGAAVCEALNPKDWKMNGHKADLVDGVFNDDTGYFEKEIDEDDLQPNIEAAEACPVRVIHIFNKATGEKIV